jgi:hypothetical protein
MWQAARKEAVLPAERLTLGGVHNDDRSPSAACNGA